MMDTKPSRYQVGYRASEGRLMGCACTDAISLAMTDVLDQLFVRLEREGAYEVVNLKGFPRRASGLDENTLVQIVSASLRNQL